MRLDPTNENHYHIMAAIRGPDSQDPNIKAMTTAVIRHFAGVPAPKNNGVTGWCLVYSPTAAKQRWAQTPLQTQRLIRRRMRSQKEQHFMHHISTAFQVLEHTKHQKAVSAYYRWFCSIILNRP